MTTQLTMLTDVQWQELVDPDAQLEQAARNLGLMVLCMTGGPELDELLDTLEFVDDIEDRTYWRGGQW